MLHRNETSRGNKSPQNILNVVYKTLCSDLRREKNLFFLFIQSTVVLEEREKIMKPKVTVDIGRNKQFP